MILPTTVEAIAVVALLFVPGFVAENLWASIVGRDDERQIDLRYMLTLFTLSMIVHALLYYWPGSTVLNAYFDDELVEVQRLMAIWLVLALLLVPILLALILGWVTRYWAQSSLVARLGLNYLGIGTSGWKMALRREEGAYLRVFLRDGRSISGVLGEESYASSRPSDGDLFLQEQLYYGQDSNELDMQTARSGGVWISGGEIQFIELYDGAAGGPSEGAIHDANDATDYQYQQTQAARKDRQGIQANKESF